MIPYSETKKERSFGIAGLLVVMIFVMIGGLCIVDIMKENKARDIAKARDEAYTKGYQGGWDNGFKKGRISYHNDMIREQELFK